MCWRRYRGLEPSGYWFYLLERGKSSESARLTWVCSKYFSHYFLPYSCTETFIGFELRFLCSVKFFLSFFFSFLSVFGPRSKENERGWGWEGDGTAFCFTVVPFLFYKLKLTKETWMCLHLVSICTPTISPWIKSLFEEIARHFCMYFRTPFLLLF